MARVRSIFLSDIHLGTRACQAQRLLEFLREYESEYLFLVGDIVDFWAMGRRGVYWTAAMNTFVQKVLKRARHGVNVIFVPGNHDEALREHVDATFGDIRIHLEYLHTAADGKRYMLLHGDEFDVVTRYHKWLAILGDQVQQQLLNDLIVSFLLAFVLVCVALMAVFRSLLCGLICMIPNLFPCAVVFGVLGWLDVRIEIGTILTASAALGIAIDDTLHFITWFRRGVSQGSSPAEAVAYAYRRCGAAMIQTTLVITLGLIVFAYSSFAPMQRFAWCMFTLLTVALIADLVILPAILLSRLGRPFLPQPVIHPKSLSELAWRVAGPRDALINFVINAPIAILVYWSVDQVPLVGHPSLLTICGPMSFLLPTITTCFGYLNGVGARKSGYLPPAWPGDTAWKRPALAWGLVSGLLSCASCVLVLSALGRAWPGFTLSKWEAVAAVGLLAAAMGYVFHSIAVSRTGKLGASRG